MTLKPSVHAGFRGLSGTTNYVAVQIKKLRPKKIYLHADWLLYQEQKPESNLQKTIDFIKLESPLSKITIVGGVPQYKPGLPTLMYFERKILNDDGLFVNYHYDDLIDIDHSLMNFAKKNDVEFYSALKAFCKNNYCQRVARYDGKIMPVAWDYGHLTAAGSMVLAEKIKHQEKTEN
jgi:lysophospholipase L1-like esterase